MLSTDNKESLTTDLKNGSIAVIPTDTLLGIVGSALNRQTVERIYHLRRYELAKPFIILIGNLEQLKHFKISLTAEQQARLTRWWPGPISAIVDCPDQSLFYLHRGQKTLAFRLPADEHLRELLGKTGPLVAPSANRPGESTATTLDQARDQLGDKIDLYYTPTSRAMPLSPLPSTLVKLKADGTYDLIRSGAGDQWLAL